MIRNAGRSHSSPSAIGWPGSAWDAYFTRLHVRYGPDDVSQDLVLYHSGYGWDDQQRYIEYDWHLEEYFRTCERDWKEDPGRCGMDEPSEKRRKWGRALLSELEGLTGGPWAGGLFIGLVAFARRRRENG